MDEQPVSEVLLATWQGEVFLSEQLDSLFRQANVSFTIVVADDGSTDGTMAILAAYDKAYPGRFRFLPPAQNHLGPQANFARLLEASRADYIFLCDQDDIWLPGKMEATLRALQKLEREHGKAMPCLVHTDLAVVDQDGGMLGPSFFAYTGLKPDLDTLMSLMTTNVVTGCTSIINRALRDRAVPVSTYALMHDHWLAQVAAAVGTIGYLNESTVLYRQHGNNALGARRAHAASVFHKLRRMLGRPHSLAVMERYVAAVDSLSNHLGERVDPQSKRMLCAFANIKRCPAALRPLMLARHRIYRREGIQATIRMYLLILRLRRDRTPRRAYRENPHGKESTAMKAPS